MPTKTSARPRRARGAAAAPSGAEAVTPRARGAARKAAARPVGLVSPAPSPAAAPPRVKASVARLADELAGAAAALALGPGVTEEETIESSKYVPGRPTRLFEEERFVFPQTYGVNRVRLLVKDPDWLFAYWDVDPRSLDELRAALGERVVALSRITLRVQDPGQGGGVVILVPAGARSWYVRTDAERRAYRAELGVTLPSGEFRLLALSNTVIVPRRGPSPERARSVMSWKQAHVLPPAQAAAAAAAERQSVPASGPWQPPERHSAPEPPAPAGPGPQPAPAARGGETLGGASDVHSRH